MTAALDEAIRRAGSQRSLAKLLGITQQSISGWVLRGRPIPAEHVLMVEAKTGVSRHDLRPDIYPIDLPPAPLAGTPATGTGPAAPPSAPPSSLADGGPVSPATDVAA